MTALSVEPIGWSIIAAEHAALDVAASVTFDQLADAARCYLRATRGPHPPALWPFPAEQWSPGDRVTNLTRAGALLVAARDRASATGHHGHANRLHCQAESVAEGLSKLLAPTRRLPQPRKDT